MTAFAPRDVLCPVELEDEADVAAARRLAARAAEAAAAFGARVTLLHVAPPAPPSVPTTPFTVAAADAMADTLRMKLGAAHRALAALEDVVRGRRVPVRSLVIAEGRPVADVILDAAASEGCDLIVLGESGRHRLRHAVLGGVAERVSHRARIPVLVFHTARDDELDTDDARAHEPGPPP